MAYFIYICVLLVLGYIYSWLIKNSAGYDKKFGKGSTKFVEGELTIVIGLIASLLLMGFFYGF